MTPEVRLSPDGTEIAVRWPGRKYWTIRGRESFEGLVSDEQVANWTVLAPVRHVERVTCPWCGRGGRALTPERRIRWHYGKGPDYWTVPCPGSGRIPADYAATTGGHA